MKTTVKCRRWSRLVAMVLTAMLAAAAVLAPEVLAGRDDWQQPERVMADMNLRPGWTVADVGCGRGYFTFRMASAVGEKGKVLAVDISQNALRRVQRRAERDEVKNVKTIRSQPADAQLPARSSDAALLCLVLHHADEGARQDLMNSIAKGLTPGGFLFVMDFRKVKNPPVHSYEELVSRETVVRLAERAGLELDAEYFYLGRQYFLRFRKPAEK